MLYEKTLVLPDGTTDMDVAVAGITDAMRHTVTVTGAGEATVQFRVGTNPELLSLGTLSSEFQTLSADGVSEFVVSTSGGEIALTITGN
ncbi:MAG: hypothetical protein ACRBBW_16350 [Cellvibrionaceae bacterium]